MVNWWKLIVLFQFQAIWSQLFFQKTMLSGTKLSKRKVQQRRGLNSWLDKHRLRISFKVKSEMRSTGKWQHGTRHELEISATVRLLWRSSRSNAQQLIPFRKHQRQLQLEAVTAPKQMPSQQVSKRLCKIAWIETNPTQMQSQKYQNLYHLKEKQLTVNANVIGIL